MEQHTDYSQETFTIFKFSSEEIFNSVASLIDISNIRHKGVAYKPCDNCPSEEILEGYWVVFLNSSEDFPSELKQFEHLLTHGIEFKTT